MHRIAVIGSGISGLAAARRLAGAPGRHSVTLLEAGSHFGGHANTVDMTLEGVSQGVDTGFLVFNHRTYPLLTQVLQDQYMTLISTWIQLFIGCWLLMKKRKKPILNLPTWP